MPRHQLTKEESSRGGQNSKRKAFDKQFQEWLEGEIEVTAEDGSKKSVPVNEAIFKALLRQAVQGNIKAARELYDRAYGRSRTMISGDINHESTITLLSPEEADL